MERSTGERPASWTDSLNPLTIFGALFLIGLVGRLFGWIN